MTPTPSQLVAAAYVLRRQRDRLTSELAEIEQQLLTLGRGKYPGLDPGETVTVIAAVPESTGDATYILKPQDELPARALAGVEFRRLFDRVLTYSPCGGFDAVAPKLLTPAKSRDLLDLCLVPGRHISGKRAYLKYA